MNCIFSN